MATPESKVKKKVKEILESYEQSYFFMPAMNGYGASGVPDFVACIKGKFYGIECKADGNRPTKLQLKNLQGIVDAGGESFVVDNESLGVFKMMMDESVEAGRKMNGVLDFTQSTERKNKN
jgi:Holliday junction resolvase